MANAPLTIRFSSDVDSAKKGMASLAASVATNMASVAGSALAAGRTVQSAGTSVVNTFQSISKAAGLVPIAIAATVSAFAAFKLAEAAIAGVKQQLAQMVEIADKASERGLSPEFFQAFISGAKGAEDRVTALEKALDQAFQATKAMLNPEWSNWNGGLDNTLTKVSAVEKAMRETRELFTTDQNSSGFDLFRNAKDQDTRIRAVLQYMQQLKAIGAEVAALDIGEKMFGSKFADDVRTGKQSVDSILRTVEAGAKSNFISNDAAKNAKELDDKLNDAWHTISERMKPDWDDLASVALRIKGVWADIISSVANYKAQELKPRPFANSTADDSVNNEDPNSAAFANPAILNQGRRRRGQQPQLSGGPSGPSQADQLAAMSNLWDYTGAAPPGPERIPMPLRRPQDAPKPPEATRDPFQVTVDQITKRIAALDAETKTIDENAAAQARAKTEALLNEAAVRANTAAGKADTSVTAAQTAEIKKKADEMARSTAEAEKARINSSIKFGAGTALLSSEDVSIAQQLKVLYGSDIPAALASSEAAAMRFNQATAQLSQGIQGNVVTGLADIVDGTKPVGQAFSDMAKSVLRSLDEMLIKMLIVQPIARALQSSLGGGGILNLFGGSNATDGIGGFGPTAPGKADGGLIRGRGGPRSDSLIARVSNGEFIVNAASTAKNRALLEDINSGRAPGYADGGYVGPMPMMSGRFAGGGGAVIQNTFMVAGDVSQGTVDRLQTAVIAAHRKTDNLARTLTSTQRMQSTGVG